MFTQNYDSFLLSYLFLFLQISTGALADDVTSRIFNAHGNKTILKTEIAPAWVPPLMFRGSFDILRLCVLTLILCVYTTVHLNVPSQRSHWWYPNWIQLKWIMIALFSPDVLVYTAFRQLIAAWMLSKQLNKICVSNHDKNSQPVRRKSLTLRPFLLMD